MEEKLSIDDNGRKLELKNPTIHQKNENCQVFNGPISGCVFAMPGSQVTQQTETPRQPVEKQEDFAPNAPSGNAHADRNEELTFLLHPAVVDENRQWQIHDEIKRLVKKQGVQEICNYLQEMRSDMKILLPESPLRAYNELVRMGMPSGDGFNIKTFQKYYKK